MKTLFVIAALLAATKAVEFNYCEYSSDILILWPDWDDHTKFVQCAGINHYKRHTCREGLLFDYFWQVCVWPYEHNLPPSPEDIRNQPPWNTDAPQSSTVSGQTTPSTSTTTTDPDRNSPPTSTTTESNPDPTSTTTTSDGEDTTPETTGTQTLDTMPSTPIFTGETEETTTAQGGPPVITTTTTAAPTTSEGETDPTIPTEPEPTEPTTSEGYTGNTLPTMPSTPEPVRESVEDLPPLPLIDLKRLFRFFSS